MNRTFSMTIFCALWIQSIFADTVFNREATNSPGASDYVFIQSTNADGSRVERAARLSDVSPAQPFLLILGDSKTSYGGLPGKGQSWPAQLATNNLIGQRSGYMNLARSSQTLAGLLADYTNAVQRFLPRSKAQNCWVVSWLGYNDFGSKTLDEFKTAYTNLAQLLRRDGATKLVFVSLDSTNAAYASVKTNLNTWLSTNVALRDYFVDIGEPTTSDGVHPTGAASTLIASNIWAAISNDFPNINQPGQSWVGTSSFRPVTNDDVAVRVLGTLLIGGEVHGSPSAIKFNSDGNRDYSVAIDSGGLSPGEDCLRFITYATEKMRIKQGGTSGAEILFNGTNGQTWFPTVTNVPESLFIGRVGSFAINTNGSDIARLWVKGSGTGSTGWENYARLKDVTNIVSGAITPTSVNAGSGTIAGGLFTTTNLTINSGPSIMSGTGAPTYSAIAGSLYLNFGGNHSNLVYVNTNGSTGWARLVATP